MNANGTMTDLSEEMPAMESTPLVSVLMTAYNREKYISEAIESILGSGYRNFELIITDDGSKDATVEIALSYEQKDSRIHLYRNEINLGDYPNRNHASTYAKGEYIMYLDSDDKTYPDSIAYCVSEMLKDPEADMGILCRDKNICGKVFEPGESIQYHFFKNSFLTIGPGGTILKRSFFESVNRYPEKYGPANDMYFNLKAGSIGRIKCLCKEFLFYRIHDGQEINNLHSYLSNNYLYLNDALSELPVNLTVKQKKWILNKNKRRFFINTLKYFFKTKSIKKVKDVVSKANFTVKDCFRGIFH